MAQERDPSEAVPAGGGRHPYYGLQPGRRDNAPKRNAAFHPRRRRPQRVAARADSATPTSATDRQTNATVRLVASAKKPMKAGPASTPA